MVSRLGIGVLVALGACASAGPPPDPLAGLDEAEALLGAGDPARARSLLESTDQDVFPPTQKARYQLLLGQAMLRTGEPWSAYGIVRRYPDEFPHSDLRPEVEQLVFDCGRALSESDKSFLIFSSDRDDAQAVLEHLIQRYPRTPHLADALQILGEMAFSNEEYSLAHTRFKDLLQQQPDSEWAPLARFRIAMSEFRILQGPRYDMQQMRLARNELESFLMSPPESPEFVAQARAARQVVVDWIAQRHLVVADFYKAIHNRFGERHNLTMAVQQFPDTDAGRIAAERLAAMAAENPDTEDSDTENPDREGR